MQESRKRSVLLIAGLAIALCFAGCSDGGSGPVPPGPDGGGLDGSIYITDAGIIADQNFRPNPNGFHFENYGSTLDGGPVTNMTPALMSRMFNGACCASGSGETCQLSTACEIWMNQKNTAMAGGHCEGMAVLSTFIFSGQGGENAITYGGTSAKDTYSIPPNTDVQKEIAYWFTTQYTSPTKEAEIKYAPNDFLTVLIAELQKPAPTPAGETYDIGLYRLNKQGETEGHAVSPAYVKAMGDGIVHVVVYDNNYPNVEKTMEFNQISNTFKYSTATNPDVPPDDWTGDAVNKNVSLCPGNPRLQQQVCPCCTTSGSAMMLAAGLQLSQISMNGPGDLMISDDRGGRIGTLAGKIINEMPGANVITPKGGRPVFEVREGVPLSVVIDGGKLTKQVETGVTMIAHGYVLSVGGIKLDPGRKDIITFSADGNMLSYETSSAQKPDLQIGYEIAGKEPDWSFMMHASCDSGSVWKVTMLIDRLMKKVSASLSASAGVMMKYDLDVGKIDESGKHTNSNPGLKIKSGETASFDYSSL